MFSQPLLQLAGSEEHIAGQHGYAFTDQAGRTEHIYIRFCIDLHQRVVVALVKVSSAKRLAGDGAYFYTFVPGQVQEAFRAAAYLVEDASAEYSPCLKTGGSGLAATLTIHRWSLVAVPSDFRVDGLCPSYKSGVRRPSLFIRPLAHSHVGRRVLSYDPRPHPDAGGNVSHLRERRAYWQVRHRIAD